MLLLLVTLLVRLLQITNITCSTVLLHLLLLISLAKCFSGVAELTTQLLRLIGILWLPLCQINKLGYSYPRRLLGSPTLVGHQDYFLAPLPGSIALFISSLGKYTLDFYLIYRSCYQWLLSMKLDLIGKVRSRKINKNIIRNTACLKKGKTYG